MKSDPGQAYINWINAARCKLREREKKHIELRLYTIRNVIIESVRTFKCNNGKYDDVQSSISDAVINNFIINDLSDHLITLTMIELNQILADWRGIKPTFAKTKSFRVYFSASKSWFDQKKKRTKADMLWMDILNAIKAFVVQRHMLMDHYLLQHVCS